MCQYLSKFCHNLSETVLPLSVLTKENSEFLWSNNHANAFNSANNLIASATALRYYCTILIHNSALQLDASEDEIGGVVLQNDQPVCFTLRTLSNTEQNYLQFEKHCVAIRDFKIWYGEAVLWRQIVKITSGDVMSRVPLRLSRRSLALYYGKVPSFTVLFTT